MGCNKSRGGHIRRPFRWHLLAMMLSGQRGTAFISPRPHSPTASTRSTRSSTPLYHWANRLDNRFGEPKSVPVADSALVEPKLAPLNEQFARRSLLSAGVVGATLAALLSPLVANADFAPGGTLLDREVSIFLGNPEASPSRARDNSNVIFAQDNYYKFGAAAQWIPPGSTDFPKTMPFVLSQQRYDALKKYGTRVRSATEVLARIGVAGTSVSDIPERNDPAYQLRALGLLANSFLASENTGTTNELMLARWYINEVYLRIGDYRDALGRGDAKEAETSYACLTKALNSYLTLLNRSITSKVGDQFGYLTTAGTSSGAVPAAGTSSGAAPAADTSSGGAPAADTPSGAASAVDTSSGAAPAVGTSSGVAPPPVMSSGGAPAAGTS